MNPFSPKLSIDELVGVGRVELELDADRRACVFLGGNGIGKTKLLEALHLVTFLSSKTVVEVLQSLTPGSTIANDALVFSRACVNVDCLEIKPSARNSQPVGELRRDSKLEAHDLAWAYVGARRRGPVQHMGTRLRSPLGSFAERRVEHVKRLVKSMADGSPGLDPQGDIDTWFVQRAQSSNRFQADVDKRESEILSVLRLLNAVDERIDPAFLSVDGSEHVRIRIEGAERRLAELSSGFASLLQLMQAIVSSYANFTQESSIELVRGIVFIDEIESHLHARWQSRILPTLKKALPNTFFGVATHSPLVIAPCEEGEVYRLARDDDGVVRSRRLDAPRRDALVDVLQDAFDVDVNALKRDGMSSEAQRDAKAGLLGLISKR